MRRKSGRAPARKVHKRSTIDKKSVGTHRCENFGSDVGVRIKKWDLVRATSSVNGCTSHLASRPRGNGGYLSSFNPPRGASSEFSFRNLLIRHVVVGLRAFSPVSRLDVALDPRRGRGVGFWIPYKAF